MVLQSRLFHSDGRLKDRFEVDEEVLVFGEKLPISDLGTSGTALRGAFRALERHVNLAA